MKLKGIFSLALLFFAYTGVSQKLISDDSVTLIDYIFSFEKKYAITFSYDSDLIKNVPLTIDTAGLSLVEILKKIDDKTAFNFEVTNGNTVLVKPKSKGANYKLCGRIYDNESKEALAGGLIINDRKTFSRPSGLNGEFSIYTTYSEEDALTIRYLGYKTITLPLSSFSSGKCLDIAMMHDIVNLDEVVLTTYMSSGIEYNRLNNSLEIRPENLSLLPGQTDADLLLSLEALPGINSPDGKAGNLNIRGSSSDQTLVTFDNIPIYHKGHYFGTLSPFNPKVVEKISVSRSSFTAEKGGRVGGAIDVKSKQSVPDSLLSGFSLSTIDAAAYIHIPIVKKKLSLLLAGRTSYPFDWQSPKLVAISNFVFQESEIQRARDNKDSYELKDFGYRFNDINSKLIFQPSAKQKITISALKIFNRLESQIFIGQRNSLTKDSIGFNNWGISGQWESWWTEKTVSRLSVTNSSYTQKSKHGLAVLPDSLLGLEEFKNSADDVCLNMETDFYGKGKHFIKTGYNLNNHYILFDRTRFTYQQPTSLLLNNRTGSIHSLYASYNSMFYKLHTSIGIRGNYFSITEKVNLEPRVTLNYLINNYFTFKSSWGLQKQFVTQIPGLSIESFGGLDNLLWVLADGKEVPVVKSNQLMGGVMYEKKAWLIDFELYYKKTEDLTIVNITNFVSPTQFFYGSSTTVGADMLVKKRWRKFDAWVSYTISDSKMQFDSIQAEPFTSIYNQKHVLDLDILYRLGKFKFSAGWKFRTGLSALPGIRTLLLRGAPQSGKAQNIGSGAGLEGEYLYKYPSFHQLDLSAVYDFHTNKKYWNGSVGFSLLNVYNKKNIIEQFVRYGSSGFGGKPTFAYRYSMGFAPNLFVSFNF